MVKVWLHLSGQVTGYAKGKKRTRYTQRPYRKTLHGTIVKSREKLKTGIMSEVDGPYYDSLPADEVNNCHRKRVMRIDRP